MWRGASSLLLMRASRHGLATGVLAPGRAAVPARRASACATVRVGAAAARETPAVVAAAAAPALAIGADWPRERADAFCVGVYDVRLSCRVSCAPGSHTCALATRVPGDRGSSRHLRVSSNSSDPATAPINHVKDDVVDAVDLVDADVVVANSHGSDDALSRRDGSGGAADQSSLDDIAACDNDVSCNSSDVATEPSDLNDDVTTVSSDSSDAASAPCDLHNDTAANSSDARYLDSARPSEANAIVCADDGADDNLMVIVDTEGTSLSPAHNRVVEVAAIVVDGTAPVDSFSALINPGSSIPRSSTLITGIDDAMVRDAASFPDVFPALSGCLAARPLLAHNASFDRAVLLAELQRADLPADTLGNPWICTLRLSRRLLPGLASYKLQDMAVQLGLPVPEKQHRALHDCRTTLALWQVLHQRVASAADVSRVSHTLLDAVQTTPARRVPQLLRRVAMHGDVAALASRGEKAAVASAKRYGRAWWMRHRRDRQSPAS